MEKDILKLIDKQLLADEVVTSYLESYYDLLLNYNLKAYENGGAYTSKISKLREKTNTIINSIKSLIKYDVEELFGFSKEVSGTLKNQTFKASAATMSRVDNDINKILKEGYEKGLGNHEIAKNIQNKFTGLKTWEAERIAITEINSAQNLGAYEQYFKDEIEHHQWLAGYDGNVRDSHAQLDGEIVFVGTSFTNELLYPGDRNGEMKEWINCRCSTVPFIMPYGMMPPPGVTRFRESDLIPIINVERKLPNRNMIENDKPTHIEDYNKIKEKIPAISNSTTLTNSNNPLLDLVLAIEVMSVTERTKYFKKLKKDDIELYNYLKKIFKS